MRTMDSAETIVKSTCRSGHGGCGVLVHLKEGKVTKVEGDRTRPTSEGFICPKGRASVELLYHPDRLKYPLKRAGTKGENKWQRISWDEALDTIAGRLLAIKQEFGAEAIAVALGTGRPYTAFVMRFRNVLGSPNEFGYNHVCYDPKLAATKMTCGGLPVGDYYGWGGTYPGCLLNWGKNTSETGCSDGLCGYQFLKTVKRGAKLIVVDPRRTKLAAMADLWLQIRPGADDALAMAMIHTIIEEDLYDHDFVDKWTYGFDKLAERARAYPPEKMAALTWVPAEQIRAAARMFATTKPACVESGVAVEQHVNGFQTDRAIFLLPGLTGNFDVPGGNILWVPPENIVVQEPVMNPEMISQSKMTQEIVAKRIGGENYRVTDQMMPYDFTEAALTGKPYPIRGLFIMGSNLVVGEADGPRMAEAIKKVGFTVAVDLFMNPTTQLADVVLPSASWLETDEVASLLHPWCVQCRQKVATIGECRDDKQIVIDIARRMGMEDSFPWKTVQEYNDWVLQDSGITFEELKKLGIIPGKMRYRKYEENGFATPTGRYELYSTIMEGLGYDPLPGVVETPESPYSTPELFLEYPLIITTGARLPEFFLTEGRQIESLRKLAPDPLVEINADTAAQLGIDEGDWVWIENRRGRVKQRAKLTNGIHPHVIAAQHGWWFPEREPPEYGYRESEINVITGGMARDPNCGSEPWRSFLCRVYKV
jgi:anaerobic selenocysteine-containing dehydrogenase